MNKINELLFILMLMIASIYFLSINMFNFNVWLQIQNCISLGGLVISSYLLGNYFGVQK